MIKRLIMLCFIVITGSSCSNKITYDSPEQVKKALASVVKISVEYMAHDQSTLSSVYESYVASGFSVFADKGKSYILTNKHVCDNQDAGRYSIQVSTGERMPARYMRSDDFADICLLEANGVVPFLSLATDNAIRGDRVLTIGAPDGIFPMIVDGFIGGYHDIHMYDGVTRDTLHEIHFRSQVMSAPIYPGSSGSPVLNTDGKVVGIVFAMRVDKEHIAFIVPISEVIRFLDRLEYIHMS